MNTLKVTVKDRLAVIMLDRGKSNAINAEMISELGTLVKSIAQDENIGGLLLTGKENFFSAGLDLIELFDLDEERIRQFWIDFLDLIDAMTAFPKPMVTAISGHSPAGGTVLAICSDYRVMADGKFVIGLNEIPVGIIVPESIFRLYAFWIGKRKAYQHLLEGKLMQPAEALQTGLIDEIAPPESIVSTAERKIRAYMALEPGTWSQSKMNLRAGLFSPTKTAREDMLDAMLNQWWSEGTRGNLKAIIENLKRK
ncbi:MAG: enoyl-CoA hydratase/isomerase family protein [Mucilaginibacter polytrichastri]|nr:enoyl-CoA hydratase/isomerase family protein [Mucilaginibacter polytrichastri]